MVRFIFKHRHKDNFPDSSPEQTHIYTVDVEMPEIIENAITGGGRGEYGWDFSEVIGVEVLPKQVGDK